MIPRILATSDLLVNCTLQCIGFSQTDKLFNHVFGRADARAPLECHLLISAEHTCRGRVVLPGSVCA